MRYNAIVNQILNPIQNVYYYESMDNAIDILICLYTWCTYNVFAECTVVFQSLNGHKRECQYTFVNVSTACKTAFL